MFARGILPQLKFAVLGDGYWDKYPWALNQYEKSIKKKC